MTTRAKFVVKSVSKSKYGPDTIHTVKLEPVWGNGNADHENTRFWKATPTGTLELGCMNGEVAAQFELDQEYYLDLTLAPKK